MSAIPVEQEFANSGKIIKAQHVTIFDPQAAKTAPADCARPPQVRLVKEGDVVKSIEIRCACGEVIKLDCEY